MHRKLTARSAIAVVLAFGSFALPSAFAAGEASQPWGETSNPPPASAEQKRRDEARQSNPQLPANVVSGAGEAQRNAAPPRAAPRKRVASRPVNRAPRGSYRSADGWEQFGGEAGSRSNHR